MRGARTPSRLGARDGCERPTSPQLPIDLCSIKPVPAHRTFKLQRFACNRSAPESCLFESHRNAHDSADCNAPAQNCSACNRGNPLMQRPSFIVQASPFAAHRKGRALGSCWVGGCRKELGSHPASKPRKADRVELRFCISDGSLVFRMVRAPTTRPCSSVAAATPARGSAGLSRSRLRFSEYTDQP